MARRTARLAVLLLIAQVADAVGIVFEPFDQVSVHRQIQYVRPFDRPNAPLGVRAIAGDSEGFLWVGSDSGLFRFDGIHFHAISARPVRHLQVTSDGWVWAGGPAGLIAVRHADVRTVLTNGVTGLASHGDNVFASSEHIWTGTISGLRRTGFSANGMLSTDAQGTVWFACGRQVCSLEGVGQLRRFSKSDGVAEAAWVGALRDDQGAIFAWDARDMVRIFQGRAYVAGTSPTPDSGIVRTEPFRGNDGKVWFEAESWIENGRRYGSYPASGHVTALPVGQDRHGNFWTASAAEGLLEQSPRRWIESWGTWIHASADEDMQRGCESITRTQSGDLLAACANGIFQFDPTKRGWKRRPAPFDGADTLSLATAQIGMRGNPDLWVIFKDHGIRRVGPDGQIRETASEADKRMFRKLFKDARGTLWMGAKTGLYQLNESQSAITETPLPGGKYAVALTEGPDGVSWVGYDGGIARLEPGKNGGEWTREVPVGILANPLIGSLAVAAGPVFWVSYRTAAPFSRISRENGSWTRRDFNAHDGYGPLETRYLLSDRRGWIWRGTKEGIFVSDGHHLAPEDWIQLTQIHNLPQDSISPFGLLEDTDGSIWASTGGGIAHIDPDPAWFASLPAKPIRLTRLRWQGKQTLWPETARKLSTGRGDLELDFAQWPDTVPRQRALEYRLTPLESGWRTTLDGSARYDNLSAANYRLEVRDRYGSNQVYTLQVAGGLSGAWFWWSIPPALAVVAWWLRRRRIRARYWDRKAEFIALREDDAGSPDCVGLLVAGRYRIEAEIGQGKGGFARIWKALDTESGAPVAIKFLIVAEEMEEWQRARFEKETEALRRVDHPGVVRLLDSGWTDAPWLAITSVDGPDLRDVLKSGPVGREKAAGWIRQIGDAVAAAHEQGVLHRDLSRRTF